MATIKDVAKQAGVSVTTVSRVLNGTAPVNIKTKEKIMQAIDTLQYSPSIMAQGMRTKKSKTLGVLVPDYMNPFYHELFKYIEDAVRQEGYHMLTISTQEEVEDENSYITDLVNRNVDGIIVCSYKGEKETITYLLQLAKTMPVIFLDHFDIKQSINAVFTDGYNGIKEVTKHMIDKGHKNIAFIRPPVRYQVANDRYEGYKDAMQVARLPVNEELIYEGNYHIESGYAAAKYFLTQAKVKPTAIVSATDLMAIGAVNFIKSQGLSMPEDIAVAGYDDIYISKLMTPPITTYRQPIAQMAQTAVQIFIHKINHPTANNRQVMLAGHLMVRRSTDRDKPQVEKIVYK